MSDLVENDGQKRVTTIQLADAMKIEHRAVVTLVKKYTSELAAFDPVNTGLIKISVTTAGRPAIGYRLNLDQLFFIVGLFRNSPKKIAVMRGIARAYATASLTAIFNQISEVDVHDLPADRYVYVMQESISKRYKIGISKDPERRLKELNTGNPEKLILVHAYLATDKGYQSEVLAHKLYELERIRSEWFRSDINLELLPSYNITHDNADLYCDCRLCSMPEDIVDLLEKEERVFLNKNEIKEFVQRSMKATSKELVDAIEIIFDLGLYAQIGKSPVQNLALK